MIQIIENNKHLEELKINTPYSLSTDLFNDSDEYPASISLVSPSCGSCTVARVDKILIQPKEKVQLHYTFTPNSTGFNSKRVNITYTQNGISNTVTFNFNANVEP